MPTDDSVVTDPDLLKELNAPRDRNVPPGVGKRANEPERVDPLYSTGETFTTRAAKTAYPYVKSFAGGAAKEVAGDIQTLGGLLPDPFAWTLSDTAKQAREQAGKELHEFTESADPEHPNVEAAGRFGGSIAEAWALPLPKVGALVAKGVERGGKAFYGSAPKGPPYRPKATWMDPKPKPIPPTVRGAGGKMTSNPDYEKAKDAAKEAWELKMGKAEAAGEKIGKAVDAAARGAVAGGVQPGKMDKDTATGVGAGVGASMSVLNSLYGALPDKTKAVVDFATAAPLAWYLWHEVHMSPRDAMASAAAYAVTHAALYHYRQISLPGAAAAVMGSPLGQVTGAASTVRAPEVVGKR